jgi:pimeloyl-ACP methyl ester carboxylesterase
VRGDEGALTAVVVVSFGMLTVDANHVRLAVVDWGGSGSSALLLHGLAGHAGEWSSTAAWLSLDHHVVAFDQRGHGDSDRRPHDLSRDAFVEDVRAVITDLGLAPVILIGQSLGGHTGFLTAARYSELVSALIVAEASPEQDDPESVERVRQWLAAWPTPFPSRQEAIQYFGGDSWSARVWADGLQERADGWWPAFDLDVLIAALADGTRRDCWAEWERIQCPTLVVRGEHGWLPPEAAEDMLRRLPSARLAEITGAGHDLHLDQPDQWRRVISEFLRRANAETCDLGPEADKRQPRS